MRRPSAAIRIVGTDTRYHADRRQATVSRDVSTTDALSSAAMPIRGALRASLLLLFAASTVGCPAPTGRRRGVDAAGGGCSEPTQPFSGFPCRRNNETCNFEQPCGFNGVMNTTCTCSGGIWNCGTNGICQVVVRDAGPMECPSQLVNQGDTCVARQGGLYCRGFARACDDSGTVQTQCYCTGTIWSCRATGCNDAGQQGLCPPSPPTSLDRCIVGATCVYSAAEAHTSCPLSCFCDRTGTFGCFEDCSLDVLDPDAATDATDEDDVTSDDAGDADDVSDVDDVSSDDAIDEIDDAVTDDAVDDAVDDASTPMDAGDLDAAE